MPPSGFCRSGQDQNKNKRKQKNKKKKYLDFARELKKKKLWNMTVTVISIAVVHLKQSPKARKGDWKNRKSEKNPNYIIVEIGRNT